MSPEAESHECPGQHIAVDAGLLDELDNRYAEYRQAMSTPFDPVSVLALTGQVLETVRHILTTTEDTRGSHTDARRNRP